jgi:NAD(P)-dependent dehydrogenase (short-subunit alcohol dehydrogenase family)
MELNDLRVLVTGATAGIGRETAKLFARRGATVVVTGRNAERGEQTRGSGAIVNVSTTAASAASAGLAQAPVYGATKAALESLTRSWVAAFGANGIRVSSVAPGPTRTGAAIDSSAVASSRWAPRPRWAALPTRWRSPRRSSSSRHRGRAISPARRWPPTAVTQRSEPRRAARPSRSPTAPRALLVPESAGSRGFASYRHVAHC